MCRNWRWFLALLWSASVLAAPTALSQQHVAGPAEPNAGKTAKAAPGETSTASDTPKQDDRIIIEWADLLQSESDTGPHHLRGNVRLLARDVRLYCDAADYDEDTNSLTASGSLKVVDKEATITGDLLTADFDDEIITVTGNVRVVAQKKPDSQGVRGATEWKASVSRDKSLQKDVAAPSDGQNQRRADPEANAPDKAPGKGKPLPPGEARYRRTYITCERVDYYYADDQKRMVATPRVKAVQEDRTVYANEAVYQDLERLITLTGDVVIQSKDGDEMRCEKAVIHVDEEWVKADKVSGVALRKKKTGPETPAPPSGTGSEGTAGTAPGPEE